MSIADRIATLHATVMQQAAIMDLPHPQYTLIFSSSDGEHAALVSHASGKKLADVWKDGLIKHRRLMSRKKVTGTYLRVDWVEKAEPMCFKDFSEYIHAFKRNFFRHGVAFDAQFHCLLTEMECNANALFYPSKDDAIQHCIVNQENLCAYALQRFPGKCPHKLLPETPLWVISTAGVFVDANGRALPLSGPHDEGALPPEPAPCLAYDNRACLYTGIRSVQNLDSADLDAAILSSSRFLTRLMQKSGRFIYGLHPIGSRRLTSYNTARHAGTLYALLEAWNDNQDEKTLACIEKGITAMTESMMHHVQPDHGEAMAFLSEINGELKLGGTGLALVTLARHAQLTGDYRHLELMRKLALGIGHMQNQANGTFVHVLNSADLSVKAEKRTIYYDGEAVFGLMRLYAIDKDPRWLAMSQMALDAFIGLNHWKAHDHWLAYAANEITMYSPEERYFKFGLQNVSGHLNFICKRETTYPTLLELCMAAALMIKRLQNIPHLQHLLHDFDMEYFERAMHIRAHYQFTGYFWPESVMYFSRPKDFLHTFFIRHHAFRARIDDVGHYISGIVAYNKFIKSYPAVEHSV